MADIRCAVCGAKKGEANRWWVLFQADSNPATVIGPLEEAETLQEWRTQAARFHLCGEECLYRKLSGILVRGIDRPINGTHLAQSSPLHTAAKGESTANFCAARPGNRPEDGLWLRLVGRGTLRRILGIFNHLERTAPDSAASSFKLRTGNSQKVQSTRLREAAYVTESLRITGRLRSHESLHISGEVMGTLELPDGRLTVGPNGNIRAVVSAKEVEIFGLIEGKVKADRVIVRKNATLIGDVCTAALIIENGAWFEGRSTMISRKTVNADGRFGSVDQAYR
jgi:cytoskeletal protein CcmA (bactofilin family)